MTKKAVKNVSQEEAEKKAPNVLGVAFDMPKTSKEKLIKLAKQLRKLTFPTSPVSIDLATWMASAIEAYVSKDSQIKTMDVALGLNPKRGAPGDPAKREKIAREIYPMKKAGTSWKKIASSIGARYPGNDETVTIKRIWEEFFIKLAGEESLDEEWPEIASKKIGGL